MAQQMEEIEVYYLDEKRDQQKGKFVLRRLFADELTNLYQICQRRNSRTGQTMETDEAKFAKLRMVACIHDCPITLAGRPWKELDSAAKAQILMPSIEEDTYLALNTKLQSMKRYNDEQENLSETQ